MWNGHNYFPTAYTSWVGAKHYHKQSMRNSYLKYFFFVCFTSILAIFPIFGILLSGKSTKMNLINSSAVTATYKRHNIPSVLFVYWSFDTAAGCLSASPVSVHYSLYTSTPAALQNNLHSVLSDDSLQRKPAPTHTDTPSQTNTTTQIIQKGFPVRRRQQGEVMGRKREMLSSRCEWSFPLWWDRLEIAPHHCCQ